MYIGRNDLCPFGRHIKTLCAWGGEINLHASALLSCHIEMEISDKRKIYFWLGMISSGNVCSTDYIDCGITINLNAELCRTSSFKADVCHVK